MVLVAPLVGAWIETRYLYKKVALKESHPSWVRGLKRDGNVVDVVTTESHPSWVRGLKPQKLVIHGTSVRVAPLVGAWIETP